MKSHAKLKTSISNFESLNGIANVLSNIYATRELGFENKIEELFISVYVSNSTRNIAKMSDMFC